jgi:hypothetical protein
VIRALSLLAIATLAPLPVAAQVAAPPAPVVSAPVDPARLAAARQLLDLMLPSAQRDQMVEGMIRPMMANIGQSMQQVPGFAALVGKDTKVRTAFEGFLKAQEDRSIENLRAGMPGMVEAMARAYARRFDLKQLADIRAFFETPTGRVYMAASYTIMSDPDILAWQRDLMARSMSHIQEDIGKFFASLPAPSTAEPRP